MRRVAALYARVLPLLLKPEAVQPCVGQVQFDAAVWFTHPVHGRQQASTGDEGAEPLFAENAASAARKWLWRLSVEEHAAVDRVIVRTPCPPAGGRAYHGPTVAFRREGTDLVEVERRDG